MAVGMVDIENIEFFLTEIPGEVRDVTKMRWEKGGTKKL
jgi:hypothetical protein